MVVDINYQGTPNVSFLFSLVYKALGHLLMTGSRCLGRKAIGCLSHPMFLNSVLRAALTSAGKGKGFSGERNAHTGVEIRGGSTSWARSPLAPQETIGFAF